MRANLCARRRRILLPVQTPDESGSLTVEGKLVCATCRMMGQEVEIKTTRPVTSHRRIVKRIKDGNASPYPVETWDDQQWREDEVFLPW